MKLDRLINANKNRMPVAQLTSLAYNQDEICFRAFWRWAIQ